MLLNLIYYAQVDSTNSEAWRLVEQGVSEGTIVIAKQQTAGRGQWGRIWQSPIGGLYLSIILQPQMPVSSASQITLWSAWGIANALRQAIATVNIKWPNDLVIDRRKLGGILTETKITEIASRGSSTITYAVIGIGINWLNSVPDTGIALGSLATNLSDLEALINLVLSGVQLAYSHWQSHGIASILPEYLKLLGDREIAWQGRKGIITDITTVGNLVITWQNSSKVSVYAPGEISLGYLD